MKINYLALIITIAFSLTLAVSAFIFKDVAVIKYFPIDTETTFMNYQTKLELLSETDKDEYDIKWSASSQLNDAIYLRQDVTLLYADGRLKGMLSKWKENEKDILISSIVHGEDSSHYQSISFHHGEIHYPDDVIKSIQAMSFDELYVIDSPYSALNAFRKPSTSNQKEWKETLDHATSQQLTYHWKQLIEHFSVPVEKYNLMPLTSLYKYQGQTLPTLNQSETDQIIGQLWEGLYKNYILNISESKKPINSFVPLILFDKQNTHLMVLFQDQDGNMEQLIQYYPSSDNR